MLARTLSGTIVPVEPLKQKPLASQLQSGLRKTCAECQFFVQFHAEAGYCHRHAPVMFERTGGKFPSVRSKDWCGDFQPLCDERELPERLVVDSTTLETT